jgi:hypothetical protein
MLLVVMASSGEIVPFDAVVVSCAAAVFCLNESDHLNHGVIISVTESSDFRIAA